MDTPQVRRACFRAGQPPPGQSVPVLTHGASPVAVQLAGAPHPFVHSPCPPEHENPTFFQGSITDLHMIFVREQVWSLSSLH